MKKHLKRIIIGILIVILLCFCVVKIRDHQYDTGRAEGYLTGYSIGYSDGLHGVQQNSQILAGEIVPYEYGGGLWKGFMMGFPTGYDEGLIHANGVE